jgi:spermidine synthase
MGISFEELGFCPTPLGELSLRRRTDLALGIQVYEVKLGSEFLMSSLFTAGEIALAQLGLQMLGGGQHDVVVAGLGLGYTASEVLDHQSVRSLIVVEALPAVIDWHRRSLVPLGSKLSGDERCRFVQGDFFALASTAAGFEGETPARTYDAILVDIDHSPRSLLDPQNAAFYQAAGLRRLMDRLRPGGVFGLWSNEEPDSEFMDLLAGVFPTALAHVVTFDNVLQKREAANTIYLARS